MRSACDAVSCLSPLPAAAAVGGNPRPIVVFWTGADALACKHDARDAHAASSTGGETLDDLVQRGIVVLRWRNGKSMAKSATAEDLAAYWQRVPRGDGSGIGIDEFGSGRTAIDRRMAEALRLAHAGIPGPLYRRLARGITDTGACSSVSRCCRPGPARVVLQREGCLENPHGCQPGRRAKLRSVGNACSRSASTMPTRTSLLVVSAHGRTACPSWRNR